MRHVDRLVGAIAALIVIWPVAAGAQGNGHGHAYGVYKHQGSIPSASGSAATTSASSVAIRNFGTWLDDASVLPEGQGALTFGFTYWKTPVYREFDFPYVDGSLGVSRRVQFGVSMPYFRANEPGGPMANGLGDVYLSSKIQLRDPSGARHPVGFALTPIVEVLSYAPEPGASRVSWALPFSVEVQRDQWRVYGSTGYFSRGSVFASGAIELALSNRAWLTGTLSQAHIVNDDGASEALGVPRTRTDVSGGLAVAVTPAWSVYGSIGRTLSREDPDAATVVASAGASWSFAAWTPQATKRKRR
jgi:hypothetical protein